MGLRELSVVEQRFHAVTEMLGASPKTGVADRYGISRQTMHAWTVRYERDGLRGLEDDLIGRRRVRNRVDPTVEASVCQLRADHPRVGPRRLRHELRKCGVAPLSCRATIYRILVRNNLISR